MPGPDAQRTGAQSEAPLPAPLAAATDLLPPPYAGGAEPGLPGVLAPLLLTPRRGRDVVVLIDGLGFQQLSQHLALTPTLRALRDRTQKIRTVAPATTAAAMASLLTGLPPLRHGMLGYTVADAGTGLLANQLTGALSDPLAPAGRAPQRTVDARQWMRAPALAERSSRTAMQVAPAAHSTSLLTRAAYRGWTFFPQGKPHERVDAVLAALRAGGQDALVHLHIDDVDHAGHKHGVDSEQWREALAEADALLGALLRRLTKGTRVHVVADHGMVDTSPQRTVDLADHPEWTSKIAMAAGEPRAVALRLRPEHRGAEESAAFAAQLADGLGERAAVLTRAEVLASGIYGPPVAPADEVDAIDEAVRERLPDVLVLARGRFALEDSRRRAPGRSPEVGVHGSLTSAECMIPLVRIEV